ADPRRRGRRRRLGAAGAPGRQARRPRGARLRVTKRGGRGTAAPAASFTVGNQCCIVLTAVTAKSLSTSTSSSVPSDLRRCASYGEPWSASVSTRSTVAPGTLASAAALTLAAVSPVRRVSFWPLRPTGPPLLGSGAA